MDSRSQESKKLIHNLEELAKLLVNYVANMKNVPNLLEALTTANANYQPPYGLGWFYSWFRTRGITAGFLKAEIEECGSTETLLPVIVRFLSLGGRETTSINTHLMYALLDQFMVDHKYADASSRDGLTHPELLSLTDLFILYASDRLLNAESVSATHVQQPEKVAPAETDASLERKIRWNKARLALDSLFKKREAFKCEVKAGEQTQPQLLEVIKEQRQKDMAVFDNTQSVAERIAAARKKVTDAEAMKRQKLAEKAENATKLDENRIPTGLELLTKKHVEKQLQKQLDALLLTQKNSPEDAALEKQIQQIQAELAVISQQIQDMQHRPPKGKLDLRKFAIAQAFGHDFSKDTVNKERGIKEKVVAEQQDVGQEQKGKINMAQYEQLLGGLFKSPKTVKQAQEEKREEQEKALKISQSSFRNV